MTDPPGGQGGGSAAHERTWLLVALAAVWLAWAFPLLGDGRHYFQGDTANAYYGWFHHFGTALLHGHWPMFDAQAGSAGNPLAEGQEGLYSPLTALIAVGAAVAPQVVVYATLVKFAIVTISVTGVFALARSYAVRPGLAAAAAVAVPLCGFTLTNDAPRWVAGQLVAALLPWAWCTARRMLAGGHPWPALLSAALVVTTGYVFGTMYLALVLGGLLLERLVAREWVAVRRLLLLGVFCALLAVTVYLPGILTAPVTFRNAWTVGGDGFLQMDPLTLLLTGQPTTVPPTVDLLPDPVLGARQVPFTYVAWFLPVLLWLDPARLRGRGPTWISLLVPLVLTAVWTLLPYNMGPIRMPGRVMSALSLALVLLVVVLLDRAVVRRPGPVRIGATLVWAVGAAVLAALLHPASAWLQVAGGAAVVVGLVVATWAARRGRGLPVVLVAASVGVAVLQLALLPDSIGGQRHAPSHLDDYPAVLQDSRGDVFAIGLTRTAIDTHPEVSQAMLTGSMWDLTGKPVHNGYTTIGFRGYNDRFCLRYNGEACPAALAAMFTVQPETGLRWVDLHAISTLVLYDDPDVPVGDPPAGWHVAGRNGVVVTWVRDDVVPTAGGVVWSSAGTQVHQVAQSETSTSFVVDAVGDDPSVVLSRLAWPGYEVDGARFGSPLERQLVRVELDPDRVGETVTVTFRPPGWHLELATLGGAVLLGAGWCVVAKRRRRAVG
ncbi:hypothetical protein H5V45_16635 [Nocardioides sp. KIGAM211]|uniref:YfhO family protein n=1 Tax=Nocardioides luti TaxID=2761101 RepID=A0A7X0RKV0_9ACTN|nr:hypothetical protein [Nocardioides luti]MBB6628954.1 hypothetical protein [Nocardioides luti]